MKDLLLLLCVLAAFYLGHFPMKRLDRFLERNAERVAGAAPEPDARADAGRAERRAGPIENLTLVWYIKPTEMRGRRADGSGGALRRRA